MAAQFGSMSLRISLTSGLARPLTDVAALESVPEERQGDR